MTDDKTSDTRRIGGVTNMTADEARREYNQLGPMTMTPERSAALDRLWRTA